MSDKKHFRDTPSRLREKDDAIDEDINEDNYSDDFEEEAVASMKDSPKKGETKQLQPKAESPKKPLELPTKPLEIPNKPFEIAKKSLDSGRKPTEPSAKSGDSPRDPIEQGRKSIDASKKKLDFPEAGLRSTTDLKGTLKKEESFSKLNLNESSFSQGKPSIPNLDAKTLQRIEMEECMIGLKRNLADANNRFLYLDFCEKKETIKLREDYKLAEAKKRPMLSVIRDLEKDDPNKKAEEIPVNLKGSVTSDEFIAALVKCDFKKTDKTLIIQFLKSLNCYFQPTDTVYYLKVLRQLTRRANKYNKLSNTFEYVKPLKTFANEITSVEFIRKHVKELIEKRHKRVAEEKKRIEAEYALDVAVEELAKDPNKFLELLRQKVSASNKSLNDIFKTFDENGDGIIQFDEFKKAMKATGIKFSDKVIGELFKRFDANESGSVSYLEFMSAIYGGDNAQGNVFNYMSKAEENYNHVKRILQANFESFMQMKSKMNLAQADRMTELEFKNFIISVTNVFSRLQLSDVFSYLNTEGKKYLEGSQIKKLYDNNQINLTGIKDSPAEIERKRKEEEDKKKEEEKRKAEDPVLIEQQKRKAAQKEVKNRLNAEFTSQDPIEVQRLTQKKAAAEAFAGKPITSKAEQQKRRLATSQYYERENLNRSDLLEKFMIDFSDSVIEILRSEGKNLRDLFSIFSKETNGFLNQDEFFEVCKFITGDFVDPEFARSFFNFFVTGYPKKMSFKIFSHIVYTGKRGNSIYIKLKHKFKQHLEASRRTFLDEFQRLDASRGSGEILLNDLVAFFALNEIYLDDDDYKLLENEEIIVRVKDRKYVKYNRFMKIIFPDSNPIEEEIKLQAIMRIKRFLFKARAAKAKIKAKEEAIKAKEAKLRGNRGSDRKEKSLTRGNKKVMISTQPPKVVEEAIPKLKEIYEFEKSSLISTPKDSTVQESTNVLEKKRPTTGKKNQRADLKALTMEDKLKRTLGEPIKDDRTKEKLTAINNKCRDYILQIIDNVVAFGESLKLSKEIQKKYEARPVTKDVFVTLQDLEINIIDLIPRSISVSTTTGRIGYMDKDGNLFQYDIANQQNLKSVNLSSKVPLKKSKIIDFAFDNKAGRIYTLTDSWMLEVWEIHQEISVPFSRLKILTESHHPHVISNTYFKRYGDTFPQFMSLSSTSHQLLVINCSCVNNSIVFVDPVSVSIFSQVYLKQDDYRVPESLTKILYCLKPKIDEMVKKSQTFEKMFEKFRENNYAIPRDGFITTFKTEFNLGGVLTDNNLNELFEFLDQSLDGYISLPEIYYLQEITKTVLSKVREEKITLPLGLQGLDTNSLQTLEKLHSFVKRTKLNLNEAFKIFDYNSSGSVSAGEFHQIISQLIPEVSFEDKENLLRVADRDGNGSINFEEFCTLFADIEHYSNLNDEKRGLNLRTHLYTVFEKAYDMGIDVEAEFLKYDTMAEGVLQIVDFKAFIRSLPFGILDSELQEILDREVVYTDNGRIDYHQIVQNPEFKKSKVISKLRDTQTNRGDLEKLIKKIESDQHYFEPQKIIVESMIYIDDFDLMLYTTITPRTSTIFVSSTKRSAGSNSSSADASHIFSNKLLAKLQGHKSNAPPTIYYCNESGCLISGDKIDKKTEFVPKNAPNKGGDTFNKEQFMNFYANIEANKQFSTDVLIWNLQKDLFDLCNANPPWIVKPAHIIKSAHYDSIVDIVYLPMAQLIVTASVDKTIKVWDPVARPHSLKHPKNVSFIRQQPGVYGEAKEQQTISNMKFAEIKRIYTGDQTCQRLCTAGFRIPITTTVNEANFTGKQANLEILLALCLSKPQLTGQTMKSAGTIKGYSLDRLEIEIPANRIDDVVPRKYYKELEDLCLERRKKTLIHLQSFLPSLLETMQVKVFMQDNDLKKIVNLFKRACLLKFSSTENGDIYKDVKELFSIFTNLPLRVSFDKFISEAGLQKQLSIPEIFYYLKKFRQIHPLNITKSEFYRLVEDVNKKVKKTVFSEKKTTNPMIESISKAIKNGEIDFKDELYKGKKQALIARDELVNYLKSKNLDYSDKDMDELLNTLDPYIINKIKLDTIEDSFGNEILEYKIGLYSRPNQIIKNLINQLDSRQKVLLIFSLNESNMNKDSYLTKDEFMNAFIRSGIPFNKVEVLELFELQAEKYSKNDTGKALNLVRFTNKLFTPAENIELTKMYYILGKLKNGFVFKRINPQQIFADYNPETKTYEKGSNIKISTEEFIQRVESINIPNLHKKELEKAAAFLSLNNQLSSTSFIPLNLLLYYFRRLEVKYQYPTVTNVSKLHETVSSILSKEDDIKAMFAKMNKNKFDAPTLRHILNENKIDSEYVDEIIARFLDDEKKVLEHFLQKLENFKESMASVSKETKLKKQATLLESSNPSSPEKMVDPEQTQEDKFGLKELLQTKTKDQPGTSVRTKRVGGSVEHIEALVNAIRSEGKDVIQKLKKIWESFDTKKTGRLKFNAFNNVILYNCETITEEMILKFQSQFDVQQKDATIDYLAFYDDYLTEKATPIASDKKKAEFNINTIMVVIAAAIKTSKVNINYAFKFFDEKLTNVISVDDFKKLFTWIKAELAPEEFQFLINFFRTTSGKIDYINFLNQIEVSNHNLSVIYDKNIWMVASEIIKPEIMEKASTNSEYIKFMVDQKLKESKSSLHLPLLPAIILHKALGEFRHEYSIKEVDDLVNYAILGSQMSIIETQKRMKDLNRLDIATEIINFDQFTQSVSDVLREKQKVVSSQRKTTSQALNEDDVKQRAEDNYLIGKIRGILKERDITLWDSIISSDMTITDQSKISLREFELILNSLNLGLTLKEKLMLFRIADPSKTKRIDLKALIDLLEEKGLTDKVMKVILEKLGIALFFNDMSFKAAFDYFDIDKDESISRNEFTYGFSQLDLGLSIFEIGQLANIIDLNQDGNITRTEFTKVFEDLFKKFNVDPSKDLSFSLYAKIKNLSTVKGVDLLHCLRELDIHHKGYLSYDIFLKALSSFGLENLKPYQISALLKLNKEPEAEEEKKNKKEEEAARKRTVIISPKSSEYKIYYESFYQSLMKEVEKNLRMVVEVTHDLLRKIYKMIQSKNVSLFESFVHFDVNYNNAISKLEFKLGLQNFNIYLKENEINHVWNSFDKLRNYKVSFNSYLRSFIDAGALKVIKFDEAIDILIKKFFSLMQKVGNFEEAFRKLDANNSGVVTYIEFKEQCQKIHLNLLPNEVETVFAVLCQTEQEKQKGFQDKEHENAVKSFTYRGFVKLALNYKNLSMLNNIFAKLYSSAKDRKILWKQQFGGAKVETKLKTQGDITLRDLKQLLRNLKLGITNDEIDTVINSFESPVINHQVFEKRVQEGAKKTEEASKEKDLLIYSLVNEISSAISRERIPLERLFFDFDTNQTATLDLNELTNLVFFLKITASKNQIKQFFEAMDFDKKRYITLPEMRGFLEESKFHQQSKNEGPKQTPEELKQDELLLRIKQGLESSKTTLQNLIYNSNYKMSEVMTKAALEKILISINIVFKKDELTFLFNTILSSTGGKMCSWEDLQNFAIKNQIEDLQAGDDKIHHIHPAVAVFIEKINNVFKKVEINPLIGFKYLSHPTRNVIVKRSFLKAIQAFNMNMTQDEILLLYEYFDEKGYGEINYDTFIEKFELLITMGILKLTGGDTLVEESNEVDLSVQKISSRHQLVSVLQKIYMYFVEKKYSKKQMIALFDRNGNGILTKDDFVEGVKALGLDIPLEKVRVLTTLLDKNDNGVIELDDFIIQVQASVPQNLKGDLKTSQAINVLRNIVERLRDQIPDFLKDMVLQEKNLKSEDVTMYRPKTGIHLLEFYKLLKRYGIILDEDEKVLIRDVFLLSFSSTFLDIENIYKTIDNLSNTLSSSSGIFEVTENDKDLNDIFEQKVYRKIGDQLRRMNKSILQSFELIDRDGNGYITEDEMRILFKNLDLDFTEREISFLISKFTDKQKNMISQKGIISQKGMISKNDFVEKFWQSFARFGQKAEPERIKDLKGYQRRVITTVLNFCKQTKKWTVEQAWVNFDYSKSGMFTLEDFKNALVSSGLFITKEDIAIVFNFIDQQTKDGKVNFMEFLDFWKETTNVFDGEIPVENEINELEHDILDHLAKSIDQREISFWEFYRETDSENKGYLTDKQFGFLLRKLGLELDDVKVEKLMRLIDTNADKRLAFGELEARLLQSGLKVRKEEEIERITWIDKGMKNLLIGLNTNLKHESYDEFFKKFDTDFDGYLAPEEYFNALRSLGKILSSEQIERLANIFQTNLKDNRISIVKVVEILDKVVKDSDTKAQQYDIASIGEEVFYYVVTNYEGINKLFSSLGDLRKAYKDVLNYIARNRKKLRGYSLMGFQNTSNILDSKLTVTIEQIQKGINLLLRVANNFIVNDKMIKLIDPIYNVISIDKEVVKDRDYELERAQIFQIGDNAAFNIDYDSSSYFSPFIKVFNGYYFRTNIPIQIAFYDKNTLSIVCADGNQFYKHLEFELKIQSILASRGDYVFKNIAKYEKKVGLDTSEKDIYLLNDFVDDKKWICLAELIKENGGLLRIPFLTRTKAVVYIIKFWASQILKIMLEMHKLGCSLLLLRPDNIYVSRDGQKIKLKSLRGCGKMNEFGKVQMAPDFYINLFDPDFKPNPDRKAVRKPEQDNLKIYPDPYLAPEMIFCKIQELDENVDTWAFGCLMYHILFGVPPKSFYEEILKVYPQVKKDIKSFAIPSDYFFHDLYPNSLINDILSGDHEIKDATANTKRMVDCIGYKSYEALFSQVIPQKNIIQEDFNKTNKEHLNRIGCYLDLIASCLDFSPAKRPSIKSLFESPVFQLDKYEDMISKQFSEIMIFYKSPSLTIRDKVLVPLRKICARVISSPKNVINLENDILHIMDIVNWSLIERKPKTVEDMKKTATVRFDTDTSKFGGSASKFSTMKNTAKDEEGKPLLDTEQKRANNQLLAKFIFQNYILDLLVFLTLRHHTQSRHYLKKRTGKIERTYDDTVRLVKSLLEIFKSIIFDMVGYQTTCSSYVQVFLENFVKFLLGEEYKLASDIGDLLAGNDEKTVIHNTYEEYQKMKVDLGNSFLRDAEDTARDEADEAWKMHFASRPYVFTESHWTPDLYLIVGPIYKVCVETVSESGAGSAEYPVIQDFIRFETENNRNYDFDMENRLGFMNHKSTTYFRRTVDYYNDIMHIAENLQILYQADSKSKSNIRVSLQYLKALLQGNNTDKIKLLLDSKIVLSAMKYLAMDDVHIKTEILEMLYEISKGYEREPLGLISQDKNEVLRSIEENIKTVGVISQLKESRIKDKPTKDKVITYSYDYYSFNKKINNKYIKQLGFIFESPVVITYLTAVVKTQAELIQNKKLMIKIFENITNGPLSIVKALNYTTTDAISSVCKIFITSRKGIEIKQNAILAPILVETFKKILSDCRPEMIDYLNHIPGTRIFLKEQGLDIPPKINLTLLYEKYTNLADFYARYRDKIVQEIQGGIIASQTGVINHNTDVLLKFNALLYQNNTMILSWLMHYFRRKEGGISFVDVKHYFDKAIDLYINIFDYLLEYAQLNDVCTDILNQIGYLFESIGVSEFHYIFMSLKDMERDKSTFNWILDKIFYFFNYYAGLDMNDRVNELREREDELRTTGLQGRERNTMILTNIMTKQSLKRYGENRLMPTHKAFQRIIYFLTTLNTPESSNLLKSVDFAKQYVEILRAQYHIISSIIQTGTENVHLIMNYAEESQIRLKTFEKILVMDDELMKEEFIKTGIIHDICNKYLKNLDQLDVSTYKLTFKFLPFRNFLPVRNEALAMISMIAQYKEKCQFIYSDLVLALTRYSNFRYEHENLKKYKKGLIAVSSIYFFTIVLKMGDPQIYYILKQDNIFAYLEKYFSKSTEMQHYYPDLVKLLKSVRES